MNKKLWALMSTIYLSGCTSYVADTISLGSIEDHYNIERVLIMDTKGKVALYEQGEVEGYFSASQVIKPIGIPEYIEVYWAKSNSTQNATTKAPPHTETAPESDETPVYTDYYRLAVHIDPLIAKQKIAELQQYYLQRSYKEGLIQVVVEQERLQLLYTLGCTKWAQNCQINPLAPVPNWIIPAANGNMWDAVSLFDGLGESAKEAFSESPYAKQ